jgi:hypothetical protein
MKLQTAEFCSFDVMTWVPVGSLRRLKRGYDQGKLLAMAVADELGTQAVPLLKKVRNTPPQSGIPDASRRRANVLNAYEAINTPLLRGKSVLLLDDVLSELDLDRQRFLVSEIDDVQLFITSAELNEEVVSALRGGTLFRIEDGSVTRVDKY